MPEKRRAAAAKSPAKPRRRRKGVAEPGSRGLPAAELGEGGRPAEVAALERAIVDDGGSVLATYREPLGGHWSVLAGLPIDKVAPTPFQRDLSEAHAKRLTDVIEKIGRYLDPVIVVRADGGRYWTPNGNHRLAAMRNLGGRSIVALVLPEAKIAYQILALNTEKAHNLREKALEVVRMARDLAGRERQPESAFALEFEEPAFLTLGLCYERRGRFSGGAYNPILKRVDGFLDLELAKALHVREERADAVLALDDQVSKAVEALKAKGFQSPYLRAFVVSRINYLRFVKGPMPSFDEAIAKMTASASRFDPGKVRADQVAQAAGPPEAAE